MASITITNITAPIAELEYDGTEGWTVEVDGEWAHSTGDDQPAAFAYARAAFEVYGNDFTKSPAVDNWGRTYWEAEA